MSLRDVTYAITRERDRTYAKLLLDHLQLVPQLSTGEAAKLLHVSVSTVRRLFQKLEADGEVIRVYGGIRLPNNDNTYNYNRYKQQMAEEKRRIGELAASLVEPGDTIYMDCGTTPAMLAAALAERFKKKQLTNVGVVTNSLVNLERLSPYTDVVLVGGNYFVQRKSFVGPLSEGFLSQFHFTKCFAGTDGMTFTDGFMSCDVMCAKLTGLAVMKAAAVYMLMDTSKIGVPSFVVNSDLRSVSAVITDWHITEEQKKSFEDHYILVKVAAQEA